MHIDVVIGNPPYNNDMYLDFVQRGHNLASNCSVFITPAKWQAKGGEKNVAFRKNIVPYMSEIVYYPVCWEVFNYGNNEYAKIHGGVSYYILGQKHSNKRRIQVKSNVCNKLNCDVYEDKILTLMASARGIVEKCWTTNKLKVERINNKWYESKDYCVCGEVFSWGGFVNNEGQTFVLLEPKHWNGSECISSDSMIIGETHSIEEVNSAKSFINSRVVRFLIWLRCSGQHCGQDYTWRFVPDPGPFDRIFEDKPLQGYTPDINGEYVDANGNKHCSLYVKYNLTEEEIAIIESVIKERK